MDERTDNREHNNAFPPIPTEDGGITATRDRLVENILLIADLRQHRYNTTFYYAKHRGYIHRERIYVYSDVNFDTL